MRNASLWRVLLGVEQTVVEDVEFDEDEQVVVVSVRPAKGALRRCGWCESRSPWFDRGGGRIFDDAGKISRAIIHFSNEFTVSANGLSLPQTERWNNVILFDDSGNPASETLAGLLVHIRLPHGGTVGLDVGRIVENPTTGDVLFQAGNFQLASGDTAALCAAFG